MFMKPSKHHQCIINNTDAQEDQIKQSNTIGKEMDLSSEMKNLQVLSID